jgi:uncharacterized protein (TIGR00369 family)
MIHVKSPFGQLLGMRVVQWDSGIARLELPLRPELRNLNGAVHGGVLAAMIDFAGSMSGVCPPTPGAWPDNVVSLSMSVNFIRPATGDLLHVCGRSTGGGRSIFMASIEVHDASQNLAATGQGAFKILGTPNPGGAGTPAGKV